MNVAVARQHRLDPRKLLLEGLVMGIFCLNAHNERASVSEQHRVDRGFGARGYRSPD